MMLSYELDRVPRWPSLKPPLYAAWSPHTCGRKARPAFLSPSTKSELLPTSPLQALTPFQRIPFLCPTTMGQVWQWNLILVSNLDRQGPSESLCTTLSFHLDTVSDTNMPNASKSLEDRPTPLSVHQPRPFFPCRDLCHVSTG